MRSSFDVPCLKCGEVGGMNLNINGMDDSAAFKCSECDAEFGVEDVMLVLDTWRAAIEWIRSAPPPAKEGGA